MLTAICSTIRGSGVDGCGNVVLSTVVPDDVCVKVIDEGSEKLQLEGVYEFPEQTNTKTMPLSGLNVICVPGAAK